jgi:hypothetical protein
MAKKPREFWVHVLPDGREEVFDAPPADKKTLHIWIEGRFELTKTFNIVVPDEDPKGKAMPKSVMPKGGWTLHTPSEPGSTTWRRRTRRRW